MAANLEEYLREKGRLPKENLGTMYFFESNRKGVSKIKEILIWNIKDGSGSRTNGDGVYEKHILKHYSFDQSPYDATFWPGDIVAENQGWGSGVGDLWGWTHFVSLDKKALEKKRRQERFRILKKYGLGIKL